MCVCEHVYSPIPFLSNIVKVNNAPPPLKTYAQSRGPGCEVVL